MLLKKIKACILQIVKRSYWVIYQTDKGVKYYYLGKQSKWTTDINKAKKYKQHPHLLWMGLHHFTMKI